MALKKNNVSKDQLPDRHYCISPQSSIDHHLMEAIILVKLKEIEWKYIILNIEKCLNLSFSEYRTFLIFQKDIIWYP